VEALDFLSKTMIDLERWKEADEYLKQSLERHSKPE